MEKQYYLPWDLTVKLALMGYNDASHRCWAKPRAVLKLWKDTLRLPTSYPHYNFGWPHHKDDQVNRKRKEFLVLMDKGRQAGYNPEQFACSMWSLTAISWEQAKEWLRKNYDIDFYERPHIGKDKKYVCDPIGQGMSNTRLQARDTPLEALKCCIEHMCNTLKPLPLMKEQGEAVDLENPD